MGVVIGFTTYHRALIEKYRGEVVIWRASVYKVDRFWHLAWYPFLMHTNLKSKIEEFPFEDEAIRYMDLLLGVQGEWVRYPETGLFGNEE